jgi:hypothetical protein
MLISVSLAADVSAAFASEREQVIGNDQPAGILVTTDTATMAGSADSTWTRQPEHDHGLK